MFYSSTFFNLLVFESILHIDAFSLWHPWFDTYHNCTAPQLVASDVYFDLFGRKQDLSVAYLEDKIQIELLFIKASMSLTHCQSKDFHKLYFIGKAMTTESGINKVCHGILQNFAIFFLTHDCKPEMRIFSFSSLFLRSLKFSKYICLF